VKKATSSTVDGLREYEVRDESLVLRRYLTPAFFEDFLRTRELYFTSAAKFVDQLEGRRSAWDEQKAALKLESWRFDARAKGMARLARDETEEHNRLATVICCFVAGVEESEMKWAEKGREGVAVETTVGRLRRELGDEFLIVPARYYRAGSTPGRHSLAPFLLKDPEFANEREVRAIGSMQRGDRIGSDRRVAVDVERMVQRVIVCFMSTSDC